MSESPSGPGRYELAIRLHLDRVHVSYVSALLRVVQAALREVAQSDDEARQRFDRRPQPVLLLTSVATDGGLTLGFAFADPLDSRPLEDLSARTFSGFLEQFSGFVKSLPQPSLWGGAARRPSGRPHESDLAMRMDQVYGELRRSPRATLSFGGRTIEIEGDRMEIG